jgi:O-6-methylguanine DNA methyltransferase
MRSPQASTFSERVASIVSQIPAGRVATYGDVARWAGKPAGARAVGTVLKTRQFELPCHRVVDAAGDPPPYPQDAAARLRAEGVGFDGSRVDLSANRWQGPR